MAEDTPPGTKGERYTCTACGALGYEELTTALAADLWAAIDPALPPRSWSDALKEVRARCFKLRQVERGDLLPPGGRNDGGGHG